MIKLYAIIILVGIIGAAGLSAKYYYDTTQSTIATLRENNAKLEVAVQISEASVKTLEESAFMNEKLNSKLQKDLQQAEKYGDELRSTLQKHNLTHLANKKPGLIEKRMQNATNKLWGDLIALTDNTVGVQHDEQVSAGIESSNSN